MAFESPNYTQVPNDLLGNWSEPSLMSEMKETELKVILALCRLTFGYHRKQVKASLSVLERMTGLSRQGVISGAQAAEDRGLIQRITSRGRGKISHWQILIQENVKNLDLFADSQQNGHFEPENVNGVDSKGQKFRHMKESNKEKEGEKENGFSSSSEAFTLWQTILLEMRGSTTKATFERIFAYTEGIQKDNGLLTVQCPNAEAKEWLDQRWAARIARAADGVEKKMQVKFVVKE